MIVRTGVVCQARLPEIGRTLISYDKEDGSRAVVVLWDAAFFKNRDSDAKADLDCLSAKGTELDFEFGREGDGQCIRAWPLSQDQ